VSEPHDHIGALAPADATALLDNGSVAGRWVLDPVGSRAEFPREAFWGAVTVHGSFSQITGEGSAGPDGTVIGRVCIEASPLGRNGCPHAGQPGPMDRGAAALPRRLRGSVRRAVVITDHAA
jgi:hypothetical protein